MYLKNGAKIFRTVTFRLTLWYAVLFAALSLTVFGIIDMTLTKGLTKRMDNILSVEAREIEHFYRLIGDEGLKSEFNREAVLIGTQRVFFRMLTPHREIMEESDMHTWEGIRPLQGITDLPNGKEVFETLEIPGHSHLVRVISRRVGNGNILQIGNTLHDDEELMELYRQVSATAIVILLICGCIVGWFMARRAMSGVERVTQTAMGIGKTDLASRVPLGNEGEEINNLARAFNDMLGRVQGLVTELKDVTNNIAHDLRSPITSIRGIAETTITGKQDIDDYREMAGIVIEESDRLVAMINVMLEIAMTEAGVQSMSRDEVDIIGLVRNAHAFFQTVAEDKGVALGMESPEEPLIIQGDLPQLQRMIANLLDNAVKFTPLGGKVNLVVENNPEHAVITVSDTGIGIAEQDLPRIFDRFYRGDRSRSAPGNGLGLSHVKAIVRAHGGEIKVKSSPGKGSSFTVILPRVFPSQ
jgi:heavy metal sensor kinase